MEIFLTELKGALIQLAAFTAVPFIVWLIAGRNKAGFFEWMGLKKIEHEGNAVYTLLLTILAAGIYAGIMGIVISRMSDAITTAGGGFAGMGMKALPAAILYGFIRTGLSEEILFRSFLLKRISERFGFAAGNTIQAVLFGALHGLPFGLVSGNAFVGILLTLLPGAFGWYQGWMNEKICGGSILPSWILHGIMNTLTAVMSL